MIGTLLGHYRILEKLGAGGMGEVYLAEDTRLGRSVAIKILPPELGRDPARRGRFETEARSASAINHPNITHIYDVGESGGVHFIAMEHVPGESLGAKLGAAPLEAMEIVEIAAQVADALAEAHERGITHRDIKPGNVMITPRGQVKVLDFGLAKLRPGWGGGDQDEAPTETMTQPGLVVGTVRYMSPEQALGREVDPRSDIFSLGIVMYELATGRPPFRGATPTETITKITRDPPDPLRSLNARLPEELERIVRKCLEKEPGRRYQSARELAVDLRNLKRDSDPGAAIAAPARRPRRGLLRPVAGAAALLAVAAAAVVGIGMLRPRGPVLDSVAVLPFENGTGDPDAEYLCDGLTEGVIRSLAQLPELRVISRRSSFTFKGSSEDPQVVGRKLGVGALVMGRVTQRGDQYTVSAELVDVADNRQLWGGRFDDERGDLLAIETALSGTLAGKLRREASARGTERGPAGRAIDPEAHKLYLRGRELMIGSSREMNKAVDYLVQATDRDPGFALAHATLARAYMLLAYHSVIAREDALARSRAALEKALSIDDRLAEAYAVSGEMKLLFDWDWEDGERDLKRAIELDPNSDLARLTYAEYLTAMGRFDEAMVQGRKAKELDPLSSSAAHMVAFTLMGMHEYDAAIAEFRGALDLNPNWTWGYIKLSKALADSGRCEDAVATTAEAEAQIHGASTPLARAWLGYTYAICGETERAHAALRELDEMKATRYVDPGCYAELYAGFGDKERMLDKLEESVADRSPDAIYLPVMPDYFIPELRDEPRFLALLERMNLPAATRSSAPRRF